MYEESSRHIRFLDQEYEFMQIEELKKLLKDAKNTQDKNKDDKSDKKA
ncbi:hypothetical protein [Campylobacter sp. 19-13652]|nr:hypothetical protein [Campylobacter sp. 19-13652]BCX79515.1 hypothetical protein LBC_09770 [Campylobacter sp. 19-13652]